MLIRPEPVTRRPTSRAACALLPVWMPSNPAAFTACSTVRLSPVGAVLDRGRPKTFEPLISSRMRGGRVLPSLVLRIMAFSLLGRHAGPSAGESGNLLPRRLRCDLQQHVRPANRANGHIRLD